MRSPLEWAIRLLAGAAAVVGGWFVGTGTGLLVGTALDGAASEEVFVSTAMLTIPVFGLMGITLGILLAYLVIRRTPRAKG